MAISTSITSLFKDMSVLSPHYLPAQLPFREEQIKEISRLLAPSHENKKPRNLFIYGKTGTGKTSSMKKIMEKIETMEKTNEKPDSHVSIHYLNCRIYNSRYRILQKLLKGYVPELERAGFGLPFLYEKLIEVLQSGNGKQLIVVLDEIDMIKDLDELVYTLTRVNDEVKNGGLTIVGISNKLSFKDSLDPRSKSSLYEIELVFPPYTSEQLKGILMQRVESGFLPDVIEAGAVNLVAAITAQESGDARYALKLLTKAGEMAEQSGRKKISDNEVEAARRKVEVDLAQETIATLPENHQIVLYSIANLAANGSRYARLEGIDGNFLLSGEIYEKYEQVCKQIRKRARSIRWYHEYLHDLEMLGLIITTPSSHGMRGHTTLIRLGYEDAKGIEALVKKNLEIED